MSNSTIRSEIKKFHQQCKSWEKTAVEFNRRFSVHLSKASYDAWATRGVEPADPSIRDAFGLGARKCPTCHRSMKSLQRNRKYNDNLPEYKRKWRALPAEKREKYIQEAIAREDEQCKPTQ